MHILMLFPFVGPPLDSVYSYSPPPPGKRTQMVPEETLQVCKDNLAETELKVSLCHRDLDVTTKERDTYKGICKVNEQIEEDKHNSQESVAQMQKMIEELKAAKSC